jgi:hypothetical protein
VTAKNAIMCNVVFAGLALAQLRTRIGLICVGAPVEIALLRNRSPIKADAVVAPGTQ